MAHPINLLVSNGTTLGTFEEGEGYNSTTFPRTPPTIQDFLINNTATGNTTQFAFYVSDSLALQNCTFSNDNGTRGASWYNTTVDLYGNGTGPVYANFTVNPFYVTTLLNFTFYLWNTNSSLVTYLGNGTSPAYRTLAIYNTSMPYTSLGQAIAAVEGENNWTTANDALGISGVEPYEGLILNQNTTAQYEALVDSYANGTLIPAVPAYNQTVWPSSTFTSTNWTNPSYAYDNNPATAATGPCAYGWPSLSLGLTFSASVNATEIQYLINCTDQPSAPNAVNLAVFIANATTGPWTNVLNAVPTWGAYTNITFSMSVFTHVEYNFSDPNLEYGVGPYTVYLNETCSYNYVPTVASYRLYDYPDVLMYCAYAQKMNITNDVAWPNFERDIIYALGNISMCQTFVNGITVYNGSLPGTDTQVSTYYNTVLSDFGIWQGWALYGYYYANNSWVPSAIQAEWNISAAYAQFNAAVNYSLTTRTIGAYTGPPEWIWGNLTSPIGSTLDDRYYDESGETIQDYLIFYYLLNVTAALSRAIYLWSNYVVPNYWSTAYGGYFKYASYSSDPNFECEAAFFLKIISIMKYYSPNLANYSLVLTDIGNRFLSSEWMSAQWIDDIGVSTTSYNVVVHDDNTNNELRLENTLGAWQALLGCYLQMSSGNQTNMEDMLMGNATSNIQPAWSLLLESGLWNSTTKQFYISTNSISTSASATAMGEITLFQMGIIPGTSTIAFPLEELNYEYTDDIDPVLMAFNLNQNARQITIPVVAAGTITFDFGQSPITYNFTSGGVYIINFTSSLNMISSVAYQSALPGNLTYFYLPAHAIVPEFPRFLLLPLFMAATLLALSTYRRKRLVHRNIARALQIWLNA
jgi:hypothetical protein